MRDKLTTLSGRLQGAAADSILLTFVRVITMALGLIVSKLLSVHFSLQDYGTYSQGMLIVSTVSSITILGLTNAVTYFYNSNRSMAEKEQYVCTMFALQYALGILSGVCVLAFQLPIIRYFDNEHLKKILFFAAWMPCLQNLIPMLQVLFVSIGKAKLIAARNLVISVSRLLAVLISCYITDSIVTLFAVLLLLDAMQTAYFIFLFGKYRFPIRMKKAEPALIGSIFKFSIPMAVYVLMTTLNRDIDKYVIGYFAGTSSLAIYSNAAKLLPFDLITRSFVVVLVPVITRQISQRDYGAAKDTFRAFLRIGCLTSWPIILGVIVGAKEVMIILYDEKFLPGLSAFITYLFTDMLSFASTTIILSAKGKTKKLMVCSCIVLSVNLVLNIILYKYMGMLGPAVSTLAVTAGLVVSLLKMGAEEIDTDISSLLDWKELFLLIGELLVIGTAMHFIKPCFYKLTNSVFLVFVLTYGCCLVPIMLLNYKKLIDCLKTINGIK